MCRGRGSLCFDKMGWQITLLLSNKITCHFASVRWVITTGIFKKKKSLGTCALGKQLSHSHQILVFTFVSGLSWFMYWKSLTCVFGVCVYHNYVIATSFLWPKPIQSLPVKWGCIVSLTINVAG